MFTAWRKCNILSITFVTYSLPLTVLISRFNPCIRSVSKKFSSKEYMNFMEWANKTFGLAWCMMNLWDWDEVKAWRGCVIAVADYKAVGAIPEDAHYAKQCRFWNEGYPNWWLLSNVKRLPNPIPCRGNVGMWQLDEGLID